MVHNAIDCVVVVADGNITGQLQLALCGTRLDRFKCSDTYVIVSSKISDYDVSGSAVQVPSLGQLRKTL
ncbi:hypothetical protein G9P44_006193 [Scheffersomyces stipitis]|nr:hypothetical protein G9P44_006193 [Scheffersomyces stipitis]